MSKYDGTFASVDIARYVNGLGELVNDYIKNGYEGYLMSFMFKLERLDISSSNRQMRAEIERIYGRFLTECVRCPWSNRNRNNRPVLIACPDWPVHKRTKSRRTARLVPKEGVHWGGVLLVPPFNRLKVGVKDHFERAKRHVYVRTGEPLSRVHVEHVKHSHGYATDYALKSLKSGRCSTDDLLILPFSRSEHANRG